MRLEAVRGTGKTQPGASVSSKFDHLKLLESTTSFVLKPRAQAIYLNSWSYFGLQHELTAYVIPDET